MWIKGGRILDAASRTDVFGDIHIEGEKIAGIYPGGTNNAADEIIDAKGLWVIPGLIDMHVHLRDPGYEHKEDLMTGSLAAATGGVSTVLCMANTHPVNDNPSVTNYIVEKAKTIGLVRILPAGAVTMGLAGKKLVDIAAMKRSGIAAVSDDGMPIQDTSVLERALQEAFHCGLPLISHCQDKSLSGHGVMNESALSRELGLEGIPKAAEDAMVKRDVDVAEKIGKPIHITHIATMRSLGIISEAKDRGVGVSCDVTPHHLLLTQESVRGHGTNAKMYPPLRDEADRMALIEGLRTSVIDCIASDHAPHTRQEKALDFKDAPFGMLGLQTLLPAILKIHVDYQIDLLNLLACVTIKPARILGIEGGMLKPGERSDITIVDPNQAWTFNENHIVSKSTNSAFIGTTFPGKVVCSITRGRVIYSAI